MVILQPFLELTDGEPYRVRPATRDRQLAAVAKTLQVSLARDHGEYKTTFTIFPELSIPAPDGITLVDQAIGNNAWPTSSFVIGGIDGLGKAAYETLCNAPNTAFDAPANAPGAVLNDQWVNCLMTWVKAADGSVRRWIQPKVCPSWPEQNITHHAMFRGRSVQLFKCRFENNSICRFFSLICFDWIGSQDGTAIVPQLLETVSGLGGGEDVALHWMFVLQFNPAPNHPTFLSRINQVLTQAGLGPSARRDNACLVFCNASGRASPGRVNTFGRTSLVFPPFAPLSIRESCRPSYSGKSELIRGVDTIKACKDALFRENGPCIHSVSQNITVFVPRDVAHRASSLEIVNVHPWIDGAAPDARTPGGQVACCVKWANDELDVARVLEHPSSGSELAVQLQPIHTNNIATIRVLPSLMLQEAIEIAAYAERGAYKDADYWDATQALALETLLHSLDILKLAYNALQIGTSAGHASVLLGEQPIDIVIVRGDNHEVCAGHARDRVTPKMRHKLVVVSRDRENLPLLSKHKRIVEGPPSGISEEAKITEPGDYVHVSFFALLQSFRTVLTRAELEQSLSAELAS